MNIKSIAGIILDKFKKTSLIGKLVIIALLIGTGWFGYTKLNSANSSAVQYQTSAAEKGTLVVAVSGSGQVASVNSGQATTQASGVVKKIYIKDGDQVTTCDP